jgi:5,10-methylenetetrahydrofolate reductase
LKNNLRDSLVPDAVIQRLQNSSDPEQEGVEICAEQIRKIAEMPGIAGVHIFTPGKPELVAHAIRESGLRKHGEFHEPPKIG